MRSFRFAMLGLLLIPCWVIAFRYNVDLDIAYKIIALDLSEIYRTPQGSGWYYGPISLVFYRVFRSLTYFQLEVVWLLLQTVAYLLFWLLLEKLYPFLKERRANAAWFWVFLFALNPLHNNFQSGNIQIMLMAALLLAEVLTTKNDRASDIAAGLLVALSAAVKVFPVFMVVYYLVVKRPSVWLGMLLGSLLSVLLPLAVFGAEDGVGLFQGFFANLFAYEQANSLLAVPDILCLPSLLARLGLPPMVSTSVLMLVGVGFFASVWRRRQTVSRHDFALALAVMAILNPSTRVHYFIFFVPAFCSLLELKHTAGAFAVFTMMALTTQGVVGKTLNDKLEYWNVPTLGGLLLIALIAIYSVRQRNVETNSAQAV